MPTISHFFGILIKMFYNDHNPPHFHAKYGNHTVVIAIDTLEVIKGKLPKRAMSLVLEWAADHRDELRQDWELARQHKTLNTIEPLE